MAGEKKTNVKKAVFSFDLANDDAKKALDFILSFKRKQSRFLIALLLWYKEHSEEYNLTFLPDEKKIIDKSKRDNFLGSFGFTEKQLERIIGEYSSNQLDCIERFFKEVDVNNSASRNFVNQKKDTEPEFEEDIKKESVVNEQNALSDSYKESEMPSTTENKMQSIPNITEANVLEKTGSNDKHEDADNEDDEDDDWLLDMAGTGSE